MGPWGQVDLFRTCPDDVKHSTGFVTSGRALLPAWCVPGERRR